MKISQAAEISGCHLETIRYYERIGLMPAPERTASGYREYSEAEVDRLRFITRSRDLGFSLEEIRSLLRLENDPTLSCGEIDAMARAHLIDIRARIGELERIAQELDRTIDACAGSDRSTCAILATLRESSGRAYVAPGSRTTKRRPQGRGPGES